MCDVGWLCPSCREPLDPSETACSTVLDCSFYTYACPCGTVVTVTVKTLAKVHR